MTDSAFEILRPNVPRGSYKAVLFDFDGTLSLIREGWHRIMVALCVEALQTTGTDETEAELARLSEDFVMALNGQPAIFQMVRLAEEVTLRGGTPKSPGAFLAEYDRRLGVVIQQRSREILDGQVSHERWAVPRSHGILEALSRRGLNLYLASGTQLRFVRPEADLLQLTSFFGKINAPDDNDATFSKRGVIERILKENNLCGEELLSFGDGVVETEEVRRVGGTAIAVASDEMPGDINRWKRDRLVPAGADVVIADYRGYEGLLAWLFDKATSLSQE